MEPVEQKKDLPFGEALRLLIAGFPITRDLWKTPGISTSFLTIEKGSIPVTAEGKGLTHDGNGYSFAISDMLFENGQHSTVARMPSINICTPGIATGPWTPGIVDLLANDWEVADVPAVG